MSYYFSVYPGIDSSTLMPSYYTAPIKDYSEKIAALGMSVDPRTANQLGELNIKSNSGVRNLEIQGIQGGVLESIPDQHFDEIKRLSKFIGVKPSLHGPLVEASGIGERGWTEENRLSAEKQIESAVLRSHRLDPDGNVSVTLHSTAQLPEFRPKIKIDGSEEETGLWVVNEESGAFDFIKPEKRFFPEKVGEEKVKFTGEQIKFEAQRELDRRNNEYWTESLSQVNRFANYGEEILDRIKKEFPEEVVYKFASVDPERVKSEDDRKVLENVQRELRHGQIYLRDAYRNMRVLFDKAWTNIQNDEDKKKLEEFAKWASTQISSDIEKDPQKLKQLGDVVDTGLKTLSSISTKDIPKMWKPLDEFAIKKSAETFANVAMSSYKQFGSKSPIINIENPPAGSGLSRAEDLKRLIEESRDQLAKNLVDDKKMSRSEAEKVAEKMIGATWDVGHINMIRKKGYSDKDVIKETKTIAPFVKHVHLSDNFGLDHTELPMGMGNVPLKPMIDELKKAGFKGKQIIEAGNWWQYFAEHGGGNPFKPTIEALNSPVSTAYGQSWGESGKYGAYYLGHGPVNPAVHHNLYGAGFQNLPVELGGEIPGDRGRFSGTPNQ